MHDGQRNLISAAAPNNQGDQEEKVLKDSTNMESLASSWVSLSVAHRHHPGTERLVKLNVQSQNELQCFRTFHDMSTDGQPELWSILGPLGQPESEQSERQDLQQTDKQPS